MLKFWTLLTKANGAYTKSTLLCHDSKQRENETYILRIINIKLITFKMHLMKCIQTSTSLDKKLSSLGFSRQSSWRATPIKIPP